jgi:hypothetical protein
VGVDIAVDLTTTAAPDAVLDVVADLGRYPEFLDIVAAATPAVPDAEDTGPAWSIDLRGQLGPFRRTKRLRMVRAAAGEQLVTFERRELDGRRHSPWRLEVVMAPDGTATTVTMRLHYGGSLWVSPLDRLLAAEIERGRPRFRALVEAS